MVHEYPEFFARFYDFIYKNLRNSVDNKFFLNEIQKTNGKVLEIGVGTGRLFTDALNKGADIYGIDISPAMLDVLKTKLEKEQYHRISAQNIIDFQLDHKFDLIIAPFRVFMHVLEKEEQIKSMDHVYEYLNPGGRFIFDAFVPDMKLISNGIDEQKDFDEEYVPGKRLRRYVTTRPDLINQNIDIKFKLKWDEDDGFQIRKWDVPMRFFFRYELEHLIERSAFKNDFKILGDYEGNELTKDSKEFIMVCRK